MQEPWKSVLGEKKLTLRNKTERSWFQFKMTDISGGTATQVAVCGSTKDSGTWRVHVDPNDAQNLSIKVKEWATQITRVIHLTNQVNQKHKTTVAQQFSVGGWYHAHSLIGEDSVQAPVLGQQVSVMGATNSKDRSVYTTEHKQHVITTNKPKNESNGNTGEERLCLARDVTWDADVQQHGRVSNAQALSWSIKAWVTHTHKKGQLKQYQQDEEHKHGRCRLDHGCVCFSHNQNHAHDRLDFRLIMVWFSREQKGKQHCGLTINRRTAEITIAAMAMLLFHWMYWWIAVTTVKLPFAKPLMLSLCSCACHGVKKYQWALLICKQTKQ